MRILTLAIAGVLAISCLAHGAAAQQIQCYKMSELIPTAKERLGEVPKWMGKTQDGKATFFLLASKAGTWGLFISTQPDQACLINGGAISEFLIGTPV